MADTRVHSGTHPARGPAEPRITGMHLQEHCLLVRGNVSSSSLLRSGKTIEPSADKAGTLQPRRVLFGGWLLDTPLKSRS